MGKNEPEQPLTLFFYATTSSLTYRHDAATLIQKRNRMLDDL